MKGTMWPKEALACLGRWQPGGPAGRNGRRVGLKETIAHSALFVDGRGHFDVEIKVDDPDAGIDLGYSPEDPAFTLRGE